MRPHSTESSQRTRTLYYGDNLPVLKDMPDDSVDLIYLDPPFNSKKSYNIIYPDDLGQVQAFEDTWIWTPECDSLLDELGRDADLFGHRRAVHLLDSLVEGLGKTKQMSAYLVNMSARLIEMYRLLKPTGSIYLHCDPTASHYLKIMMDAIFGGENFRNEIVWKRYGAHNDVGQGPPL